ncbi:MAG: Gfo/Idh/MocA family oxidoreductase [Phycisphaerales bacterium]|jgi:predicted dehydrogenase|nr:Gfo/Idh/MocA family oxidoreductase [Phycisphaerales bacterium]
MADVKWLLVGTGDIVQKRVAEALAATPNSQIVGICGSSIDRVNALADRFNAHERHSDLAQSLQTTTANAVYLARPVEFHASEAIAVINADKHVLIEKPLARTAAEAEQIIVAAKNKSLIVGCAYYRRCNARFAHARRLIREGTLGKIVLIRMAYIAWFNPAADDPKRWRVDPVRSGGGPAADMGSHMFDVLIGLMGMPTRLIGQTATLVQPYTAEDTATALMGFPDGAQATACFGWSSKTWTHEMEIIGSEGKLTWRPYDAGKVLLTLGRETQELDLPSAPNVHQPLVEDFVQAIMENRPPVCPIAEAAKTDQLLDQLYARPQS